MKRKNENKNNFFLLVYQITQPETQQLAHESPNPGPTVRNFSFSFSSLSFIFKKKGKKKTNDDDDNPDSLSFSLFFLCSSNHHFLNLKKNQKKQAPPRGHNPISVFPSVSLSFFASFARVGETKKTALSVKPTNHLSATCKLSLRCCCCSSSSSSVAPPF